MLTNKGKECQVSVTKGRAESCKHKWSSVPRKIKKGLNNIISPFELELMSNEEAFHQYYVEYTELCVFHIMYVTFHDPQEPTSCNRDNELMTNEVDGQIVNLKQ